MGYIKWAWLKFILNIRTIIEFKIVAVVRLQLNIKQEIVVVNKLRVSGLCTVSVTVAIMRPLMGNETCSSSHEHANERV